MCIRDRAGLERVATARGHGGGPGHLAPGAALGQQPPGYFDGAAPHVKERSTVGSASATGSVGGRTTWASSSDVNEADKMSEDQDDGASSTGGFSDEGNASLVGFGEGATSTADGPVSVVGRGAAGRAAGVASPPAVAKGNAVAPYMQQQQQQQQQQQSQSQSQLPPQRQSGRGLSSLSGGVPSPLTPGATEMQDDARMQDTMAVEPDAPGRVPPSSYAGATGTETAERIVRERRLDEGERGQRQQRGLGEGGKGVRQYYSEDGQI
ncbi:MAG: hypothetical protein M1832_006108 [Thelocarpon impressellum]|nr:MAG: hypothetical protein M1832_006108 [Thelocarpon impressellum]